MKKTILAAMAVFAMTLSVQAQTAQQGARGAQQHKFEQCQGECKAQHQKQAPDAKQLALRKAEQCKQALGLDQKQFDKVFKAYQAFFEGFKPDQKRSEQAVLEQKLQLSKKMQKILSSAQFAQWEQLEARHAQRKMQGHGPQHRAEGAARHPQGMQGKPGQMKRGPQGQRPDSVGGFHGASRQ